MKRAVFTTTTTLPPSISRDAVLKTLHNHPEMIELNPLVIHYSRCEPNPAAPAEERDSDWTWYELTDRISFLPGGLLRGNISYKGSFRDIPRGLRTHVYAPTGLDIRTTWSVGGSQPGEEIQEKVDPDTNGQGLFLREEVDLRCPFWSVGFVKKTMRRSHGVLVDQLAGKAGHGPGHGSKQAIPDSSSPAVPVVTVPPPPEIRINDVPASKLAEAGAMSTREKRAIAQLEY